MDRRTLIAILLSAIVLIGIPILLEKTGLTPPRQERVPQSQQPSPGTDPPAQSQSNPLQQVTGDTGAQDSGSSAAGLTATDLQTQAATSPAAAFPSLSALPGRDIVVESDLYSAHFNTIGAQLTGITLKEFNTASGGSVQLAGAPTLQIELGADESTQYLAGAPFEVSESTDASGRIAALRFTAVDTAGLQVVLTYSFTPETYLIELAVEMDQILNRGITEYRLGINSWPLITEGNIGEDVKALQAVSLVGSDIKRDKENDLRKKGERLHTGAIGWTAASSKYFAVAIVPIGASAVSSFSTAKEFTQPDGLPPELAPTNKIHTGIVVPVPAPDRTQTFLIYAGPNDYWTMKKVGHKLQDVVDLGWRWLLPFSRTILQVMVFLKDYIPNFGVVIIVVSALVKLVFHPLTAASLKSMRAMQRLQPEIEKLKKKFSSDSQRLNKEMMALYKDNKVNPIGGCLPMVIQMPVLIALYQVFLHSIDLRQAPFFLWINDLSSPDVLFTVAEFPIRALPVIMYGSSVLQSLGNPGDARQRMTMHLMNLFMLVLFYNLPSGLVLYWTVTNLLTAVQQYIVRRGEKPLQVNTA